MRILLISNYYPPFEVGGLEQNARDVVEGLERRGHDVCVLTSKAPGRRSALREPKIVRRLHLESPDHVHYHTHYALLRGWRDRQNQRILSRLIAQLDPDIVFIWGMWNLSRRFAIAAERLCSERLMYYIASPWPTEPDPHTAYWNAPAARAYLRKPKRFVGGIVRALAPGNRENGRLDFGRVLCVSEFMKSYMVNDVGVPEERIRVIFNGVDVERFAPVERSSERSSPLRLLYAGTLASHKGVNTAVEAMGLLAQEERANELRLSIVGAGHPHYVSALKEQVRTLRVEKLVTFSPRVDYSQMPALLRQHDVLVLPSQWAEPLARMLQEAMACGLVVICSATGGSPEIVNDAVNGLTFEAGDAEMLARKIAQVAGQPHLRTRLSEAARRTVVERFTLDRMVGQIESYLAGVCRAAGNDAGQSERSTADN